MEEMQKEFSNIFIQVCKIQIFKWNKLKYKNCREQLVIFSAHNV